MTQKNEKDSKKAHFPTPPWKKNARAKAAPAEEPVPAASETENETPETCEEPVPAETPKASEPEKPVSEEAPESATEVPESVEEESVPETEEAPKSSGSDIRFSNIADAFLKVQATLKKTQEELEKTKADLEKATDAYTRSVADFDNYRRRTNEERPKNMLYAKGDIAKDIFPVLDNFKLGLEAAEKQHPDAKAILEGFSMIAAQLKNALSQHGIIEINPLGTPFNPQEHESLSMMPSDEVPADHVLFVQRTGYKIGERLLRPASVVISAGKQQEA